MPTTDVTQPPASSSSGSGGSSPSPGSSLPWPALTVLALAGLAAAVRFSDHLIGCILPGDTVTTKIAYIAGAAITLGLAIAPLPVQSIVTAALAKLPGGKS